MTTRAKGRGETSPADDEFLQQLYRGGELLAANKVIEAKEYLERAHQLQPRQEKAQNLLGLCYFKLGMFDRAAELYEMLVRDNPVDPTLRVNLGLVYLKTNALQRAAREFETATDLAPEHQKAQNYLGLTLAQMGEYGRAREHFLLAGSDAMAEKMSRAIAGEGYSRPASPQPARARGFPELEGGEQGAEPPRAQPRAAGLTEGDWGSQLGADAKAKPAAQEPEEEEIRLAEDEGPSALSSGGEEMPVLTATPEDAEELAMEAQHEAPSESAFDETSAALAASVPLTPVPLTKVQLARVAAASRPAGMVPRADAGPASASAASSGAATTAPATSGAKATATPAAQGAAASAATSSSGAAASTTPAAQGATTSSSTAAPVASGAAASATPAASGAATSAAPAASGAKVSTTPAAPAGASAATARAAGAPSTSAPEQAGHEGAAELAGAAVPPLAVLAPAVALAGASATHPFLLGEGSFSVAVDGELLTRLDGLVAFSGPLTFQPEMKRFRGRATDKSFGEGPARMARAKGRGVLYMEPSDKRTFLAVDLGEDSAYFRDECVFAFEEPVMFENGRVPSDIAPDLDLVHLRGQGRVLLSLPGPLRSVPVGQEGPVTVPMTHLVGWHGNLTPRVVPLLKSPTGEVLRTAVELGGEGFALIALGVR
ncbi:tetratricopeptide repeat protein [Pyxidicoccus parkwayensis]|uniref:Tetratricopeptide repeat protein n=1 Tax=Pyxidicoccus parkwayensis TaxID=2813578 RepID=A0ABX7P3M3_9BACT|nr:tetratricopeptide repeat protein [Pyxidicoccus parkwaysis]QSQ25073.1 tetratricopeptide repeat protein [Pyxidicoccus parkwaysis]